MPSKRSAKSCGVAQPAERPSKRTAKSSGVGQPAASKPTDQTRHSEDPGSGVAQPAVGSVRGVQGIHQFEAGVVCEGFTAIGFSASAVRNLGSGERMPPDAWLRVAGFVGSHQPVALFGRVWPRTPWTVRRHYQRCGRSCPCCRAALGEMLGSCDACWELWQLKCVCIRLKMAVQTYGEQY